MEECVARLEANVEHILSDVSDIKTDVQRSSDKIDAMEQKLTVKIDALDRNLTAKIDALDQNLSGRIDDLKDSVTSLALTMQESFAALKIARVFDRVWWSLMSGALLGIMARTFQWI